MPPNRSDRSGAESGKALRNKLAGGVVGGGGEPRQSLGEVALLLDALKLAGAEDRIEHRRAPAGVGVTDEEVLFAIGTRANAVFHSIGIDEHVAMSRSCEASQFRPALL